jgi:CDP-glucose 4,6-dehydratase
MESMVNKAPFLSFFKGKKVVLTGHTGFKGSWLAYILHQLGAEVTGIALKPKENALYYKLGLNTKVQSNYVDIRDTKKVGNIIKKVKPEVIFHLAAQPLVIDSYNDPIYTYQTNVIGTANVIDAMRHYKGRTAMVVITTDKVYHNNEWAYAYREEDRLGGYDPYSSSKACTEVLAASFRSSFFNLNNFKTHKKSLATARAGNVIGGGDFSDNRIIPDIVRSLTDSKDIYLRNPQSVRPWQHVLEPVIGYLKLAHLNYNTPETSSKGWNFGPFTHDVLTVEELAKKSIDIWEAKETVHIQKEQAKFHEANLLKLDITLALTELEWTPLCDSQQAIDMTMRWYKDVLVNKLSPESVTTQQIATYLANFQ